MCELCVFIGQSRGVCCVGGGCRGCVGGMRGGPGLSFGGVAASDVLPFRLLCILCCEGASV